MALTLICWPWALPHIALHQGSLESWHFLCWRMRPVPLTPVGTAKIAGTVIALLAGAHLGLLHVGLPLFMYDNVVIIIM